MLSSLFWFLVLIQIKHWYIDFVNQTTEEVSSKGIYGDKLGAWHSIKHGLGTFIVVLIITGWPYVLFAAVVAFLDFTTHYHIDWLKMNYGNRDIQTPAFWSHLGLDQMSHQIVYICLAWLVFA
jgi:hypothetical protein